MIINAHQKNQLIYIIKNLIILFITTNIVQSLLKYSHTEYNYFLVAITIGTLAIIFYNLFANDSIKHLYNRFVKFVWLEYFMWVYILNLLYFINFHIVKQFGQNSAALIAFSCSWILLLPKPHFIWKWIFATGFAYGITTLIKLLIQTYSTNALYSEVITRSPELEIGLIGIITVISFVIGIVVYNFTTEKINK